MGLRAVKYTSAEEYLAMEKDASGKHEYFRGEVVAMAGANESHNRIQRNLIVEIGYYLKEKPCEIFGSEYRVTTPLSDSYMYPDVFIVCGPTIKKPGDFDTLTNPSVIIEVLSPSTAGYDKTYKLTYYMQIPSLKEYIIVDSSQYSITTFRKTEDGTWDIFTTKDIGALHDIESIQFQIRMKDIYYMVEIDEGRN